MKTLAMIAAIPLVLTVPCGFAGDDSAAQNQEQILEAMFARPTASSSLSGYLAKARKTDSKADFLDKLNRNYPLNYKMLTSLDPVEQNAIYAAYKQGERMKAVRRQVISAYSQRPAT